MDLFVQIQTFVRNVESTLLSITGSLAVIGVIGLGVMYVGSAWPLLGDWLRDHPRAANTIVWGLLFLVFAGSGGVTLILGL